MHYAAILATLIASTNALTLSLYADENCSELSGAVTLSSGSCSVEPLEFSSMTVSSAPDLNGSITIYSNDTCSGATDGANAGYLGCINGLGFVGRSVAFVEE